MASRRLGEEAHSTHRGGREMSRGKGEKKKKQVALSSVRRILEKNDRSQMGRRDPRFPVNDKTAGRAGPGRQQRGASQARRAVGKQRSGSRHDGG